MIKKILKSKVAKNASWIIAGSLVNKVLAFIVGIYTARYLGPNNYGIINYALAYTTFFFSLCSLGINSIIVKEFVDHPKEEGKIMGTTLFLQGIASIISLILICLIVLIVDYGEKITFIVAFLCSLGLFFQMMDSIKYWFQTKLLSKYCSIATIIAYIITSLFKIILLKMHASVEWFAISTSIDYLCVAVILFLLYKKEKGPKFEISKTIAKRLVNSSKYYILAGIMASIYAATDRIMLKQMIGDSSVAYYSTAVSLCNVWVFVLAAIIDSMTPVIMEYNNCNKQKYIEKNKQLYFIIFYLSIIIGIIISIFAEYGIKILYGDSYLPAVNPLRVITWYTAFSYLGVARNAWIVCENKQKYLTPIYGGAVITNVILNIILIPIIGVTGAAIASLITQISTIFIFPFIIKDLRPNAKLMIESIIFRIKEKN